MMQSMKGATKLLSGMNRSMNIPALSRIAADFERENEVMDQRQEMMDDALDGSIYRGIISYTNGQILWRMTKRNLTKY